MKTKNKFLPATAFLLFFPVLALAQQAPLKQWDVRFGGTAEDSLTSLCNTPDGGLLAAGFTRSAAGGDVTENSKGGADYWIVKLDANGVKQWDRRYGGDKDDFLFSSLTTADGGFLLGGYSFSGVSGDRTQMSRGQCDYWIVKTDGAGVKQWDARFGGKTLDYLFDMKATTDGGYILAGYTDSKNSGDIAEISRGANDYWMVKVDGNGVKQWDKRFGGGSDDNLSCIIQATDGGYLLGGLTHSKLAEGGDISEGVIGIKDYWIVKTDVAGNKIWDNRIGGLDRDIQRDVLQTADGGYLCVGVTASPVSADVTETPRGVEDYWIVKVGADGNVMWNKRFGGTGIDIAATGVATVDGGFIVSGTSQSNATGDKSDNTEGKDDYWLVKMDENGSKLWDAGFGGKSSDVLLDMSLTPDGSVVLAGSSKSSFGGDKSQFSQGGTDFWILKTTPVLITWYLDQDHDGYGTTAMDSAAVFPPAGYVAKGGDCNDADAFVNPGVAELCNNFDENCNFIIDDNAVPVTITPSGTVNTCQSTNVTFTASGDGITSYQWYRDGALVNGQTNNTYSTTWGLKVYVAVTAANGCSGQSPTVTIVRNTLPPAYILVGGNGNLDLCNGTVELKVQNADLRAWQWNLNDQPVAGATSNKFYPTEPGSYTVQTTTTTTGCSKVSPAVSVAKSCKQSDEVDASLSLLYPNPAVDVLNIQLLNEYPDEGPLVLEVINPLGEILIKQQVDQSLDSMPVALNVSSLQSQQVYLLKISSAKRNSVQVFLKQ